MHIAYNVRKKIQNDNTFGNFKSLIVCNIFLSRGTIDKKRKQSCVTYWFFVVVKFVNKTFYVKFSFFSKGKKREKKLNLNMIVSAVFSYIFSG